MKRKINLGCGYSILDGWENYDITPVIPNVIGINLEKLPLPFEDNSIDEILLNQVLEHLKINPLDFMQEVYRILKPKGIIKIGLPVNSPMIYHIRQQHYAGYFNPISNKRSVAEHYIDGEFKINKTHYDLLPPKKIIGRIFQFIRSLISQSVYYELEK